MRVTHEDLQDIGREIQRVVESKLQYAFEGKGDLRVVSAAAIMTLIDYKEDGNSEFLAHAEEMLKLVNEYLAEV